MKCKFCEGVLDASARFCPHCGVACGDLKPIVTLPAPQVRKKKAKKPKKPKYKLEPRSTLREMKCMKWHKFMVNFWLFLEVLLMPLCGAAYFFGLAHSVDAALIYKYYPQMELLDKIAAGAFVLLSLLALVARFRTARLRRRGRGWLYIFYIGAILFPAGYLAAGMLLCQSNMITIDYIIHFARCLILLLINIIYYTRKKRRFVFVN